MTIPFVQPVSIAPWAMDAAVEAADLLSAGNPDSLDDRRAFRDARNRLASMIPAGMDARDIISAVVRWKMLNDIGLAFPGTPITTYPQGEAGPAQKAPATNQ